MLKVVKCAYFGFLSAYFDWLFTITGSPGTQVLTAPFITMVLSTHTSMASGLETKHDI